MQQDWQEAIEIGEQMKNKSKNQRPTQFQVKYEIDNMKFERRIMNI